MATSDIDTFKQAVGSFPTGVTVVSARRDGRDIGFTVSAFMSLSLEPLMVLIAVDKHSTSLPHILDGEPMGISILSSEQGALARRFARHDVERFDTVEIKRTELDTPLIAGASAWFEGRVVGTNDGGDHTIVSISVDRHVAGEAAPLLYHQGKFVNWPA